MDQPVLTRSLLLAGIHNLMGLLWLTSYALFLGHVGRAARPWLWRRLEAVTSVALIVLGLRLALERR